MSSSGRVPGWLDRLRARPTLIGQKASTKSLSPSSKNLLTTLARPYIVSNQGYWPVAPPLTFIGKASFVDLFELLLIEENKPYE
jgi:hypothetical protein